MGRPAGWMQQLTGRSVMRSPGAPSLRREIERLFWKQIATGITSEKAAEAVGVEPIGSTPEEQVRTIQAVQRLYADSGDQSMVLEHHHTVAHPARQDVLLGGRVAASVPILFVVPIVLPWQKRHGFYLCASLPRPPGGKETAR